MLKVFSLLGTLWLLLGPAWAQQVSDGGRHFTLQAPVGWATTRVEQDMVDLEPQDGRDSLLSVVALPGPGPCHSHR